ncbi:MAG: hypothetical protein PQJ46_02000 [Spirochaetales bacterium]|nr:hypothetical protein [Spirochaetales bacterium]
MLRNKRKTNKIIILSSAALAAIIVLFFVFIIFTEYKPNKIEEIASINEAKAESFAPGGISIVSWNLGRCIKSEGSDSSVLSGQASSRLNENNIKKNIDNITSYLSKQEADVYFLQDIDLKAYNSRMIDQVYLIGASFKKWVQYYCPVFKIPINPFPSEENEIIVNSGFMTLSRFLPESCIRMSIGTTAKWPERIFSKKNCAVITIINSPVEGKDWYLININLSPDYEKQKNELETLYSYMKNLSEEGHYIIAGGNWGGVLPDMDIKTFSPFVTDIKTILWAHNLESHEIPKDWQWCYENSFPSIRSLDIPFANDKNFTSVTDGFVVSSNLKVDLIRSSDLDFESSNHNPVSITVSIRENQP